MPPRRTEKLAAPVHLIVDGDRVEAVPGEPVTVALTAAGRLTLGRSVKYHRPRGAACYVGRCDGCLMRVDGVPSVMTCRVPAVDGMVVETQNVLGSARVDLLAATDWFFPGGMNHHEMFTWSDAVNKVMQKVARRIAGIGQLPTEVLEASPAREREVDVFVVGGGPAGLFAARACADAGRSVYLVDEEPELGGSLRWWPGAVDAEVDAIVAEVAASGAELAAGRSAVGIYDPWEDIAGAEGVAPERRSDRPTVLVVGADGVERVRPRQLILATGRHLGASAFEDADAPGVVELRAACILLSRGVLIGERVALVGDGALIDEIRPALERVGAQVLGPFDEADVVETKGRPSVEGLVVREGGKKRTYACDAVAVLPPTSAAYELAVQAGVEVRFEDDVYELVVGDAGETAAPDVRVVGAAARRGRRSNDTIRLASEAAAAAIVQALS